MLVYKTKVKLPFRIKTLVQLPTQLAIVRKVVFPIVYGGGSAAGTIYVYVDNVLQQTISSSNLNTEVVNIVI